MFGGKNSSTETSVKRLAIGAAVILGAVAALAFVTYPMLDDGYQKNMDPIRQRHAHEIAAVTKEFLEHAGHLPFQDQAEAKPFMVLIGHSPAEEEYFANDPVLKRDATWANASKLEAILSEELGRTIHLPRDPQTVPTFAPNVYLYFVVGTQMTVVSHLRFPNQDAVKYNWHGESFYAYTICSDVDPKHQIRQKAMATK